MAAGRRAIDFTSDIGCLASPCDFNGALGSNIGAFLRWDPAESLPPAGYIGDGFRLHKIIGSPNGTNFFRIEGPSGSNLDDKGNNVIQTPILSLLQPRPM